MPFRLTITQEFKRQLAALPARERQTVEGAILSKLLDQPTTPTNAIIHLRPNPFAEFELRAGDLRVLYNVDGNVVHLLLVGRKVGNKLIVEGEEFHGHQDHPPEPTGNGSAGGAE